MLEQSYRQFAQTFAARILDSDFVAAREMLAPWLRQTVTPERLRTLIKNEVQEVAEANEVEGEFHPASYKTGWNSCTLEDLKKPRSYREPRRIAEEITEKNYRQWMVIQFQPDQQEQDEFGIDGWLDWWMMLVEVQGELTIGFFEIEDPD